METTYTKSEVEKIIRSYHAWLCGHGVNNEDGLATDFTLSSLDVYNGYIEDADSMPFSELVSDFFTEGIEIDEPGHPVSTPFEDALKEIK